MKQATKLNQVMLLIKSLSKAEKRYIRLYTNLQNGDKHYMVLYDLASPPNKYMRSFAAK
jgi:cell division septal protein FtsQ